MAILSKRDSVEEDSFESKMRSYIYHVIRQIDHIHTLPIFIEMSDNNFMFIGFAQLGLYPNPKAFLGH